MRSYGDDPARRQTRWLVVFVGGPWDDTSARYYAMDGFPDMLAGGGRYVFADVDDVGRVIYFYEDEDAAGSP